jgi:hypothetical protein
VVIGAANLTAATRHGVRPNFPPSRANLQPLEAGKSPECQTLALSIRLRKRFFGHLLPSETIGSMVQRA